MAKGSKYGMMDSKDPMVFWSEGIAFYAGRWIKQRDYSQNKMVERIETPLLKAIFYSANPSQAEDRISTIYELIKLIKKDYLK